MKFFLDTEFIEDGRTIDLLSIALVAEDGRELYAEVDPSDVDYSKAVPWVKENVIDHLWHRQKDKREFNGWTRDGGVGGLLYRKDLAPTIRRFCNPGQYGRPEFWAYYADYDWVVLCQLFGRMIDLPEGWPMYCMDLKQLAKSRNIEIHQEDSKHVALEDARWVKSTYERIMPPVAAPVRITAPPSKRTGDPVFRQISTEGLTLREKFHPLTAEQEFPDELLVGVISDPPPDCLEAKTVMIQVYGQLPPSTHLFGVFQKKSVQPPA